STPLHTMSTLSAVEFSELQSSVAALTDIIKEMSSRTASAATPPAPSPVNLPASSEFVPPISLTSTNGASLPPSLCSRFPDIKAAVITEIIIHKFKAADLHKLDPTNHDKETAYTFNGSTNQFKISNHVAKDYKNPFSIIIPLQHYFCVLSFHVGNAMVTHVFYQYIAHLLELIAEY
ncbi:hypothetical protein H0H87_004919, partial [Tephrocybe sp. NHM501043]